MFQGPDGQVAVRMGPSVTAGEYFVIYPDDGGHYTRHQSEVDTIEMWPKMTQFSAIAVESAE